MISIVGLGERDEGGQWVLVARDVMDLHGSTWSGFLAGVRNVSVVPPIATPRGFPLDASGEVRRAFLEEGPDALAPSWLSTDELRTFDYKRTFEDRRVARSAGKDRLDGAVTCEPGEGRITTYEAFLGPEYFEELRKLERAGAQRLVFWFSI